MLASWFPSTHHNIKEKRIGATSGRSVVEKYTVIYSDYLFTDKMLSQQSILMLRDDILTHQHNRYNQTVSYDTLVRPGGRCQQMPLYKRIRTSNPLSAIIHDGKKYGRCSKLKDKFIVPEYLVDKVYGRFVPHRKYDDKIVVKMNLSDYNLVFMNTRLRVTINKMIHFIRIPTRCYDSQPYDNIINDSIFIEYIQRYPVYVGILNEEYILIILRQQISKYIVQKKRLTILSELFPDNISEKIFMFLY